MSGALFYLLVLPHTKGIHPYYYISVNVSDAHKAHGHNVLPVCVFCPNKVYRAVPMFFILQYQCVLYPDHGIHLFIVPPVLIHLYTRNAH